MDDPDEPSGAPAGLVSLLYESTEYIHISPLQVLCALYMLCKDTEPAG